MENIEKAELVTAILLGKAAMCSICETYHKIILSVYVNNKLFSHELDCPHNKNSFKYTDVCYLIMNDKNELEFSPQVIKTIGLS